MIKKLITFLIGILFTLPVFSQEEWEDATPSGLVWKTEPRLTSFSTSLSNLSVSNLTSESSENKRNHKWSSLDAYLSKQLTLDRPCEITLVAKNVNCYIYKKEPRVAYSKKKVKGGRVAANIGLTILMPLWGWSSWLWNPARETITYYYKDDNASKRYWGYTIEVKNLSGTSKTFTRNFCDGLNSSTDYMDSDNSNWRTYSKGKTHNIRISFTDDKSLEVYDNEELVKTFANVQTIEYFCLRSGIETKLEATNFSIKQKSNYGMAKPRIDEAMTKMQKEDWYNAARDLTYVIETLRYANFDVLFARGFAYAMQEHYKTAIEDFTKALSQYGITTENRESAYYLRGLCRANIGDEQCITDMRNAGQDGKIWLRENDLENYVVGSSSNNQSNGNKSGSNSRFLPKKFRSGGN